MFLYISLLTNGLIRVQCFCGCSGALGSEHVYWSCPGAGAAVTQAMEQELSLRNCKPEDGLQRRHIWLLDPPCSQIHHGIWSLICAAAINEMRTGYCTMYRSLQQAHAIHQNGARAAVHHFRYLLGDICSLDAMPTKWRTQIPRDHPFIYWNTTAEQWQPRRLMMP